MKTIITIVVAILIFAGLPFAIVAAKASVRGRGAMGGAVLALGLAFSAIFDPKVAAAIEHIQNKKEIGDTEDDLSGGPPSA